MSSPTPSSRGPSPAPREDRFKVHLVVAGASQWGQYACAQVLHRAIARGGRVTLIVARRFEDLFRSRRPTIKEWESYSSLEECIHILRSNSQPIDYVFDDHLHHLVAQLLEQEGEYRRLGYVVTGAEEHYPYARMLVTCCDRVLVEKPVTKLVRDVHPIHGRFPRLMECLRAAKHKSESTLGSLYSCEHYAFRKGFTDARPDLDGFILRHKGHKLLFHFRFFEKTSRESLTSRPAAMQDGSLLDVAITHGLGPLSYLLWKADHPETSANRFSNIQDREKLFDLHQQVTWKSIGAFQAREKADPKARLIVPVLAETAARVEGVYSDGNWTIDLVLESGKVSSQRDRCLRLECLDCSEKVAKSGRLADKVFLGISLGAAGYTVCDFAGESEGENFAKCPDKVSPSTPLKAPEYDGGWRSDLAVGDVPEAEVAQAAMLEAFIAPDVDDRFIPIEEACQIVRLGMEAQALAFCGRRPAYVLDHDFRADHFDQPWPERRKDQWNPYPRWKKGQPSDHEPLWEKDQGPDHHQLKKLWKGDPMAGDRLAAALGLEDRESSSFCLKLKQVVCGRRLDLKDHESPAFYRIVTILGPEGFGNTDLAWRLKEIWENTAKQHGEPQVDVHLLHVSRDEQWCQGLGSGTPTEDRLLRDLAKALKIESATAEDLVGDLLARIIDCRDDLEKKHRILILNGVDRLGRQPWEDLLRLLNQLPASHRLVFFTNRGDQACGLVFETAEFVTAIRGDPAKGRPAKDHYDKLLQAIDDLQGRRVSKNLRNDQRWKDILLRLQRMAQGNITVERQLCSWLSDVVLPRLRGGGWTEIENTLAAISVPRTVTPTPERLLDRISMACLAALDPADRNAITVMSRLPDGVPAQTLHSTFPGLAERIEETGSLRSLFVRAGSGATRPYDRGTFVLFPRVRRAAVKTFEEGEGELRDLQREMEDRRMLLALPRERELDDARLDRLLAVGERGIRGLGKLDLDGTLLEERCLDLVESFEVGLRGRVDSRPARLLSLLVHRPTNLGMLARARLLSLYAWPALGRATTAAEILGIMKKLAGACKVADRCSEFTAALQELHLDPVQPGPSTSAEGPAAEAARSSDRDRKLQVETHRSLLTAELFRTFIWSWLLNLPEPGAYIFEPRGIRAAADRLKEYLEEPKEQDRQARRLRARLLTVLALFYARKLPGTGQPPLSESFGFDSLKQPNRRTQNEEIQRLTLAIHLLEEALENNEQVAREGSDRLAEGAQEGACRNRLNLILLWCRLGEIAGKNSNSDWRKQAHKHFTQASCEDEPFHALAQARLVDFGVISRDSSTAAELAEKAQRGYRRRGQEYFVRLAERYRAHLLEKT